MARPEFIITPEVIKQAESYASRGLTKKDIAAALGITYETLNEKAKKDTEFSEALKRGRSNGIAHVANLLIKNAEQMNASAQIFYLKAVGKWSDQSKDEIKKAVKSEIESIREIVHECLQEKP
jgi:predicted transcriptional regulator